MPTTKTERGTILFSRNAWGAAIMDLPMPLSDKVEKYDWAISIVQKRFAKGLTSLTDDRFLSRRYLKFQSRNDPVYAELLRAMDDEALAKTFVSYWTIAHTLATESRFWLEESIVDIIIKQHRKLGRNAVEVYSQSMLSHGFWSQRVRVADLGEEMRENLTRGKPWREPMKKLALEKIDMRVGQDERFIRDKPPAHDADAQSRFRLESRERDLSDLKAVAGAVSGKDVEEALIHCNLLVVEPDNLQGSPNVRAFRFANPKTLSSHAIRKQERVNLLRLYALLVQEKPLREASNIRIYLAEALPREGRNPTLDRYPDYFSDATYWSSKQLWEYIGVPFEVVSCAIRRVARNFREQLIAGLRGLLP